LFDQLRAADVIINLSVNTILEEDKQLQVQTKVVSERKGIEECYFRDQDRILAEILKAKESAKVMFFDFATEEMHNIMGAQYASD
jgi:hypothetical protein